MRECRLRHLWVVYVGCVSVTGHHKGDRFAPLDNEGWRGDGDIW